MRRSAEGPTTRLYCTPQIVCCLCTSESRRDTFYFGDTLVKQDFKCYYCCYPFQMLMEGSIIHIYGHVSIYFLKFNMLFIFMKKIEEKRGREKNDNEGKILKKSMNHINIFIDLFLIYFIFNLIIKAFSMKSRFSLRFRGQKKWGVEN